MRVCVHLPYWHPRACIHPFIHSFIHAFVQLFIQSFNFHWLTYVHKHANTHAYTHAHARTRIRTGVHVHAHTHIHTHTRTQARTHTRTRTHTYTQTHRHTDIQTHRHTDTQTHRDTGTQTHRQAHTQTHTHTDTTCKSVHVSLESDGKGVDTPLSLRHTATHGNTLQHKHPQRHPITPRICLSKAILAPPPSLSKTSHALFDHTPSPLPPPPRTSTRGILGARMSEDNRDGVSLLHKSTRASGSVAGG